MDPPAVHDQPRTLGDPDGRAEEAALTTTAPSFARAEAARQTMEALAGGIDVFEQFFEHVEIGLALADLTTRYIRVNATYAALVGRPPEDLIGVVFADVMHPDDRPDTQRQTTLLLSGQEQVLSAEGRYEAPVGGGERWVLHGVNLVRDADGRPAWFAVSAQDITERRHAEGELRAITASLAERAVRDPLTGLANRALLEDRLRGTLSRDGRSGGSTGLLFLDLDGFKAVNDQHGHGVGDDVLRVVASRLTASVRPSDMVARLGGDEFVVLAEGTAREGLDPLVARLTEAVLAPVVVGDLSLQVGVSVGMAVSTDGEADPAALLDTADRAMYAVKRAGGSRT